MTLLTLSDNLDLRRASARDSWQRLGPVFLRWIVLLCIAGAVLAIPFALLGSPFTFALGVALTLPSLVATAFLLGLAYGVYYITVASSWAFGDSAIVIRTLGWRTHVSVGRIDCWSSASLPGVPGATVVLVTEKGRWFEARPRMHTLLIQEADLSQVNGWFTSMALPRAVFPHPGAPPATSKRGEKQEAKQPPDVG